MQQLSELHDVMTWLRDPGRPPAAVEVTDLEPVHGQLAAGRFPGSLFLGCELPPTLAAHLVATGATVIPHVPDRLFRTHRSELYTPEELFRGFDADDPDSHLHTLDHRVYEQYLDDGGPVPWNIAVSLARRLHDHAITDAIQEMVAGREVVAIMGGHSLERREARYAEVAYIARTLTRDGYLLASGGGPGAMEATHLGAWFAGRSDAELEAALSGPFVERPEGSKPNTEYADPDWLHRAMALRAATPASEGDLRKHASLGVPTWLYGHEPPACFASHIAKYFANSVREDGLLTLANHGVVFSPGSAGTIQEIFQDLTQNHYGTLGVISPMILFGKDYWTHTKPVWPLLEELAKGQAWGELLHLADDPDEVVEAIKSYEPLHHLGGSPDRRLESALRRVLNLRGNVHLRHVAEPAAPVTRDLGDGQAVHQAVTHLVHRGLRRVAPLVAPEVPGPLRREAAPGDALAHWLTSFLDDDWLHPGQARETARALAEAQQLAVWSLPEADVWPWFEEAVVPSRGLLVIARGKKLSVWAGGLAD